jgi:uncharacterized protein (TIGR00106 family)
MLTAEVSVVPIGTHSGTSVSNEVAAAFDAIRKIRNIKVNLTPMGTQIESDNMQKVLNAIEAAHLAMKSLGVKRIVSMIHIDERLDKLHTLEDKVDSVMNKLK